MKIAASLVLLSASLSATGSVPQRLPVADQPGYQEPAQRWKSVDEPAAREACRDRIEQARAASGKPRLDRTPAGEEGPLLLYAVDHRVDGCGVLVPVNDPADIRQSPPPSAPELRPAR